MTMSPLQWYTKAAEKGHLDAQYNLGVCMYYGRGVDRNIEQAVSEMDSENFWLMYALGRLVFESCRSGRNLFHLFLRLTYRLNQGHVAAEYALGVCYEKGRGVQKDLVKSMYVSRDSVRYI